ncbi:MAG TPA: hypothetical protein VJN44_04845, partial [Roseateles sp.]|nr:hypothetical protein [Roseateles sp.]
MKHLKKIAALWAAAALSLPGSALAGFVWTESGPNGAGSLLPTAQTTYDSSFNALSGIQGFLTATVPIGGNPLYQVDLYKIRISDTAGFSARISDPLVDFGLFLFDATGMGVYMSEDGDGLNPLLAAGDPNGPLSTGVYYLAVATHGSIALDAGLA